MKKIAVPPRYPLERERDMEMTFWLPETEATLTQIEFMLLRTSGHLRYKVLFEPNH